MANQLIIGRALDGNGYVAPGAKATIYADGTTTLISVYSDVGGSIVAANPIIADADGFWPQRYVTEDAKTVVTDSSDVALYTLDPAPVSQGTGSSASAIAFTPSVPVPRSNVQDAIDYVAAASISGFATFGLGITGNATLLANLDATGTGAGVYRFDGATTGTFPTGVAAADTGAVELWRQTASLAMMELHHATSNRVFRRRMTATVWGAWREVVNVNQATVQGDLVYRGASDFARLAKGTASQVLAMNGGATAPEWVTPGFNCVAWGNFDGTALTFRASGNCASITRPGTGVFEITMTNALTDANYAITVTGSAANDDTGGSLNDWYTARPISSTVFRVRCYDQSGAVVNPLICTFAVFR